MNHTTDDHARLVALAREMIGKVRGNGHDVCLDPTFGLRLGVDKPAEDRPSVMGRGLASFAVGVDLTLYAPVLQSPERDQIVAEALAEA